MRAGPEFKAQSGRGVTKPGQREEGQAALAAEREPSSGNEGHRAALVAPDTSQGPTEHVPLKDRPADLDSLYGVSRPTDGIWWNWEDGTHVTLRRRRT